MAPKLPSFEGLDVVKATVKITKAGDGLSDALTVEPRALKHGDEVFYVLRGIVVDVSHPELSPKDPDLLVRRHTVVTQDITEVERKVVKPLLDAAKAELRDKLDAAEGKQSMVGPDGKVKDDAKPNNVKPIGSAKRTRKSPPKKSPAKTTS